MAIGVTNRVRLVSMLAALAVLALAGLPQIGRAEGKRYPASLCRQHAGPSAFLYFSSLVAPGLPEKSEPRHNGGICPPPQGGGCPSCQSVPACRNDPAFSVRVDCPIPKSFPDAGVKDVTVDVIDRHDVLNVECFLTSVVWKAALNDFQQNNQKLVTAGSGNNIQPLKFSPLTAPGPAAHWYVACTLPASSAIVSYFVEEQ
jgi:hypothetical protein